MRGVAVGISSRAMSSPMRRGHLVALLAVSSPVSIAFETAIRRAVFNADMNLMRGLLNPYLTPVAWALLALTGAMAAAAVPVHRALHRRMLARLGERADDPAARASAATAALYIAASAVQFPSLIATMTFTMGADLAPAFASLWVAALGVGLIGVFGAR